MPDNVEGPSSVADTAEPLAGMEPTTTQRGERSPGSTNQTSTAPDRPGRQDEPAQRSRPISTAHATEHDDNDPGEIATTIDRQGSPELSSSAPARGVPNRPSSDEGVHRPDGSGARQYLEEKTVEIHADQEVRGLPLPQQVSDERPTATDEDEPLPGGPRVRHAVRSRGRSVETLTAKTPWDQMSWPELFEDREAAQSAPSEPTVRVTIGRVEVRAVQPHAPPQPQSTSNPRGPRFTLDDYSKERNGGGP